MRKDYRQKGFTLLESLVAIAIFSVGISASVMVITQSINIGTRTKDKIVAVNLATEGIEVIRNIRDNNWLSGRAWTQGIADLNDACLQWNSDYNSIDVSCASGTGLIFNGGYYIQTNAASQFSRTISTQSISSDEIKVISSVSCGIGCSISLEEYLLNWK